MLDKITAKQVIRHYIDLAAKNKDGYKNVTFEQIGNASGLTADEVKLKFGGEEFKFKALTHYLKGRDAPWRGVMTENEITVSKQLISNNEW